MVDYAKLLATTHRLITKNGRVITLARKDESVPIDAAMPWKGSPAVGDPSALPEITYETYGVFVPPNTVRQFGLTALGEGTELKSLLPMTEQIIICPGLSVTDEIRQYTTVKDRSLDWGVLAFQVLRPADIPILSLILVRR